VFSTTGRPRRAAVIGHALPDVDGKTALSFRELVEVWFIRHFLRAGVSWRNIRRAAAEARRDLLSEAGHRLRFSTDGVTIFADPLAGGGDRTALDLGANQYVILHVLAQSIRSEFDPEAADVIRGWQPAANAAGAAGPAPSFRHPIVEPGVPTRALADALRAEGGDAGRVAALFGVSEDAARQAAAFAMTVAAPARQDMSCEKPMASDVGRRTQALFPPPRAQPIAAAPILVAMWLQGSFRSAADGRDVFERMVGATGIEPVTPAV
jgi:hypothetical protein